MKFLEYNLLSKKKGKLYLVDKLKPRAMYTTIPGLPQKANNFRYEPLLPSAPYSQLATFQLPFHKSAKEKKYGVQIFAIVQ